MKGLLGLAWLVLISSCSFAEVGSYACGISVASSEALESTVPTPTSKLIHSSFLTIHTQEYYCRSGTRFSMRIKKSERTYCISTYAIEAIRVLWTCRSKWCALYRMSEQHMTQWMIRISVCEKPDLHCIRSHDTCTDCIFRMGCSAM